MDDLALSSRQRREIFTGNEEGHDIPDDDSAAVFTSADIFTVEI